MDSPVKDLSHTHAYLGLTITCNQQVRTVSYPVVTNSWASSLNHRPLNAAERSRFFQQQEVTLPIGVMGAPLAQPSAASSQPEGLAMQAHIYSWFLSRQCRSYHEAVSWVAISYVIQCFRLSCLRRGAFRVAEFGQHSRPGAHAWALTRFNAKDECMDTLVQFCLVILWYCVYFSVWQLEACVIKA